MKVKNASHESSIELPEVVMPFVQTSVNSVNGKTFAKIAHKEYARAVNKKVAAGNCGKETNPLKWWWQVEE